MKDEKPLVSIIIATYKRTKRLIRAIESANNQIYQNIEIIVVDDNPPGSVYRKRVEEIMSDYPKIIYIRNPQNMGGAMARNAGINVANGEFIAFLDDDDTFAEEKIEKQYRCYLEHEKDNAGMIYCYSRKVDDQNREIGEFINKYKGRPLYQHMLGCIAGTSLWFCPKKALVEVGKFEDAPCKQDSILLLKLLVNDYSVYCVPDKLVNYTEHNEERISGLRVKNIQGIINFRDWCRKYYSKVSDLQKNDVEYQFSKELIPKLLYNNERKQAFLECYNMFRIAPLKIDTWKATLKLLMPSVYRAFLNIKQKNN